MFNLTLQKLHAAFSEDFFLSSKVLGKRGYLKKNKQVSVKEQ